MGVYQTIVKNQKTLNKLEWKLLLAKLAQFCQTQEAAELSIQILPNLTKESVVKQWHQTLPLKELISGGYIPPIGALESIQKYMKDVVIGKILQGEELRIILTTLESTKTMISFCNDFAARCHVLSLFASRLKHKAKLVKAISRSVDRNGQLLDTASDELRKIRTQKRSLSHKIEQKLSALLNDQSWSLYLQDEFYTIRGDRYVVPVRLDGRGRLAGNVIDTSASGQTLFIEPHQIANMNHTLQDLELSEKLEIIRIFKELSQLVASEAEDILNNYTALIDLDLLTAKAHFSLQYKGQAIHLLDSAGIDLKTAFHPMVTSPTGEKARANDISLKEHESILIISGPNAGGKTVVLKTVGLIVCMAKAGLLLPADESSKLYLFDNIYIEMGDAQSITANLSTFSGHIQGIQPIIKQANHNDLVLLDELAVGTEPNCGSAIAQAILEHLVSRNISTFVTTHYDNLKLIALQDKRFRNASMEYSLENLSSTYRLILDLPGQSFGIEVARQNGLPQALIERANHLKGNGPSSLDHAITQLNKNHQSMEEAKNELEIRSEEAQQEKLRWEQEVRLLKQSRSDVASKLEKKFKRELEAFKLKFREQETEIKNLTKQASRIHKHDSADIREDSLELRTQHRSTAQSFSTRLNELVSGLTKNTEETQLIQKNDLKLNQKVLIKSLNQKGLIKKIPSSSSDRIEVEVGRLNMKVSIKDLAIVGAMPQKAASNNKQGVKQPSKKKNLYAINNSSDTIIKTSTNTIDLRGKNVSTALEQCWQFIESAILKDEPAVMIIHGYGSDSLKNKLRKALSETDQHHFSYRPGFPSEGGDEVTVIFFDN